MAQCQIFAQPDDISEYIYIFQTHMNRVKANVWYNKMVGKLTELQQGDPHHCDHRTDHLNYARLSLPLQEDGQRARCSSFEPGIDTVFSSFFWASFQKYLL